MTRRLVVFKKEDTYLVSQEFNGDKSEAGMFTANAGIKADWPEIVGLFDGADTPDKFGKAVSKVEELYGYNPVPLEIEAEMPAAQEVWMMSHGNLILATRYGEPMVKCLADVVEQFGFKSRYTTDEAIDIKAKNTDGEWCTWFTIFPDYKGKRKIIGHNTDQCNIWLYETRPDMTPERCMEFFEELSRTMGLYGEDKLKVRPWIDPEDWQGIAGVHVASQDVRYTGKEDNSTNKT